MCVLIGIDIVLKPTIEEAKMYVFIGVIIIACLGIGPVLVGVIIDGIPDEARNESGEEQA